MTIKITEQKNLIVVRRWKYSPERKRSLPTQVYSVSQHSLPEKLPKDVIQTHNVDVNEQQQFIEYVANLKEKQEKTNAKHTLRNLANNLNKAKSALLDTELKNTLTLEQYEDLSETVNEIKKIITKNKNTIKKKEDGEREEKPRLTIKRK